MNRKSRYMSKTEAQQIEITTRVIRIEEQNVLINNKYKTVFYCESKNRSEGRMCIVWGRTVFKVGSEVILNGRIHNDVFLVWKLTVLNPKNREFSKDTP